jgi:ribosomal protein S18 acetylase RimI-like enzyme
MSQTHPQIFTEGDADAFGVAAPKALASLSVERLTSGQEQEVLAFLAERPILTFVMSGFIRDNGLESPRNRGSFYSCRDAEGRLVGVALLGHATQFEARSDEAIIAFAHFARTLPAAHIIGGEPDRVELFWANYCANDPSAISENWLLYELRHPIAVPPPAPQLRPAELAHVEQVARVHAEMAFEASGVNPLEVDAEGFVRRTAQRIEKGRVWMCVEDGRLNFKADIVSEMPELIYLEGVHVHQDKRGKGFGLHCLTQLCSQLLKRTRSIVVLVNADNAPALSLYKRAGFKLHSHHRVIYPRAGALM